GRVPVESVRNEIISGCDMALALCEAAGCDYGSGRGLTGRSYAPLAFGRILPKKQPWHNLVHAQYRDTEMVRDSRYKLILRNQAQRANELYDLSVDPRERLNQFDNPAYLSIRDQMSRLQVKS